MILPFVIFVIAYVLSVYFRRKEFLVLAVMSVAFMTIGILYHTLPETIILLLYGALMTMMEFSCVFFFDMWRYNFVSLPVPVWLPVGWALLGMVLLHILRLVS